MKKVTNQHEFERLNNTYGTSVDSLLILAQKEIANCGSYARILYCLIMEDPEINDEFKKTLKVVKLSKPEDHTFLISEPKGHKTQVHDGWDQLIILIFPKKRISR